MTAKVLLCEDTSDIRLMIKRLLEDSGCTVMSCKDGEECLNLYKNDYDIVILDINLPGIDGLTVFEKLKDKNPNVKVIIITAYSSIEQTVKAMKMGAKNYISKPFENSVFIAAIRECLDLTPPVPNIDKPDFLVNTKSPKMTQLYGTLKKISSADINVLILGESGSGKEHIARFLHDNSKRAKNCYVPIDCPAIPSTLFESEIFGHEAGAFTGAKTKKEGRLKRAHMGTVFFDEVADLNLDAQAKLLRTLQEGEFEPVGSSKKELVDIRVVCATSKSLQNEISQQKFRTDLYYRLAGVEVIVPPLRDRKEDIPLLVEYFCNEYIKKNGINEKIFSESAMNQLVNYSWPGNVRELKSIVTRCLILSDEGDSTIRSVPNEYLISNIVDSTTKLNDDNNSVKPYTSNDNNQNMSIQSLEEEAILKALNQCNNNISCIGQA